MPLMKAIGFKASNQDRVYLPTKMAADMKETGKITNVTVTVK